MPVKTDQLLQPRGSLSHAGGRDWRSPPRCGGSPSRARPGASRTPRTGLSTAESSPRPAVAGASCCPDALWVCPETSSQSYKSVDVWDTCAARAACSGSRGVRACVSALLSPSLALRAFPRELLFASGGVRSLGSLWSFLAHDEVDRPAQVFLGAGDVGSVPDGDGLLPDDVFDICGED